jgi:hypothetical protein
MASFKNCIVIIKNQNLILIGTFSILFLILTSCSKRDRNNPFGPQGNIPITLQITSNDKQVEISWNDPYLKDLSGYNLYRKEEGVDNIFILIAEDLPPDTKNFVDLFVDYQKKYSYQITLIGSGIESNPSPIVSIVPGPGFNWIVDKWGFQILKTTYDTEHVMQRFYTPWPPTDMAIGTNNIIGVILYGANEQLEIIRLDTGNNLKSIYTIKYPFAVEYDPIGGDFWIIDSSGVLYSLDPSDYSVHLMANNLIKPIALNISEEDGRINVVDSEGQRIVRFSRTGQIVDIIDSTDQIELQSPEKYLDDEMNARAWIIDKSDPLDYIYFKNSSVDEYARIDSLPDVGDIVLSQDKNSIWMVDLNNFNSSIVQLSTTGTRQLKLTGFFNPLDINVNKYDGTLLVVDSGNGRVLHYDNDHQILGNFSSLNFPVKVLVE